MGTTQSVRSSVQDARVRDEVRRMRNWTTVNQIPLKVPGKLYIGGHKIAENPRYLRDLRVTHVLNVGSPISIPFSLQSSISYKKLEVEDLPTEGSTFKSLVMDGTLYLDEALNAGGNVLVHCAEGVSRSPSMVIAYLILYHGMKLDQALRHVQRHRPQAYPINFLPVLEELEGNW